MGSLGYFAVNMSLLLFIDRFYTDKQKSKYYSIHQLTAFFVASFSGTRIAIICCLLLILLSLFKLLIRKERKKGLLSILTLYIMGCFFILSINVISALSDRGNMLLYQFQNGRFSFIYDLIMNGSIKQLLIGNGLGYGTNTALIFEQELGLETESILMDGTFNAIISQFGFIFLIIYVFILIFLLIWIVEKTKIEKLDLIIFSFVHILISFATNIFEQYSFLIIHILILFFLIKRNFIIKNKYEIS
ncbi:hypothetical protein [Niallia sp. FSL W8-1348]|uniref:hypothetical protein n=1 Tax=Niallia sp. FSL W8-1348 TaxID=2954656 RepID=UPI0030F5491B